MPTVLSNLSNDFIFSKSSDPMDVSAQILIRGGSKENPGVSPVSDDDLAFLRTVSQFVDYEKKKNFIVEDS